MNEEKTMATVSEEERLTSALDLALRQQEQDRQAFHHMCDSLTQVRLRNRALRTHLCDLIEENTRLRLALANAQHGDL